MRLIDDSPASFITICFVVLYSVVGVECAMLVSGSLAVMWLTFGVVLLIAAAICAWMFRLLSDGADAPVAPSAPEVAEVTAPAPSRTATSQPVARVIPT
jgi:hypothetical protein